MFFFKNVKFTSFKLSFNFWNNDTILDITQAGYANTVELFQPLSYITVLQNYSISLITSPKLAK